MLMNNTLKLYLLRRGMWNDKWIHYMNEQKIQSEIPDGKNELKKS